MTDQIVSFDCPSCGGPLDHVHAVNNLVRCPYCSKNVIVPESLRVKAEPPPIQAGVATVINMQTFSVPEGQPPARTVRATGWLSCLLIFIVVSILITAGISIAAPVLATGVIADQLKGIIPGFGGEISGSEPIGIPDISPTIDTVLTQAVGPLGATPTPAFYTVDQEFGREGIGPGMFDDTRWVAVGVDGNLYTAEYQDGRVQKFDSQGNFLTLFQMQSEVPLLDLAISRQGVLYVVMRGEILKFDAASGASLGQVAYAPEHYFEAVTTTADGGLAALSDGDDLVRFDAAEQVTLEIPDAIGSLTGEPVSLADVYVDGQGVYYLLGSMEGSVFVYSREGQYQNRIGSSGTEEGNLRAVNDIVVDGQGRIFISDITGVLVYSPSGQYQGAIDVDGAPFGLALDDQDRLFVMTNAPKLYRIVLDGVE